MRKNILLVMPKVPYALNDWNIPPVGLLYISASLKNRGFNVYTLNLMLEDLVMEDVLKKYILSNNIDIIATGDLVVNYRAVKDIIDIAKKIYPEIITIIGGGLVTHSPLEAMKIIDNADYGIIGEGEDSICELIGALENNLDIKNVKGVIYNDNGYLYQTRESEPIKDLDKLPFPDYDGFNYFQIAKRFSSNQDITAALTTSRSCPFSCTFCSSSGGKTYRQRSLKNIFNELDLLINKYGVNEVFLNDELFAVDARRVVEFCEMIKTYHIKWYVMLRISKHIQIDLLKKMNECGCIGVFYGLESADNQILESMRKKITVEEMSRVLIITKEAGLKMRGGFIFGDTKETMTSVENTLSWIKQHFDLLENVTLSPIVLFPGSELYNRAVKTQRISNSEEFIRNGCPLINSSQYLSNEEYDFIVHYKLPEFTAELRNKIAELYQKKLNEKIFADFSTGQYRHVFTCEKCEKENSRILYSTMMFQSHFVCPYCNEKYDFFPNYLYFKTYEKSITDFFRKNNVAIWGCGETLHNLYVCNQYIKNNDIPLIDVNPYKQKHGFYGKHVYSPNDIKFLNVEIVIFCLGNVNYDKVKIDFAKKYPLVKNIYWIYDYEISGGRNHEMD